MYSLKCCFALLALANLTLILMENNQYLSDFSKFIQCILWAISPPLPKAICGILDTYVLALSLGKLLLLVL